MKRRKFLSTAAITLAGAVTISYFASDKRNLTREELANRERDNNWLMPDEQEILYLASLAPSGHNTQPWLVKYIEPYHWIIANEKSKWLPAVDPEQRETILSIGAFIQNLEYAANHFGYGCQFEFRGQSNQDENLIEVRLLKEDRIPDFDMRKIKSRRTVRSGYLKDSIKKDDLSGLIGTGGDNIHFYPTGTKEYDWLNEQTIEANRIQAYRDEAQKELAEWIRFKGEEVRQKRDGLTTATMEINGIGGWVFRNFYNKDNVMSTNFREQGIDKVISQVSHSAGWLIITSESNGLPDLLETGKRFERIFLNVRERNLAIHPMTQVLEEETTKLAVNDSIGIKDPIQFVLRVGYLKHYPDPVSVRRPVSWFVSRG